MELVNESLGGHFRTRNLEGTVGTPDKFVALTEGDWAVASVERAAPSPHPPSSPTLTSSRSSRGWVATTPSASSGSAARVPGWTGTMSDLAASLLRGSPAWQTRARWFFDRAEKEFPSGTVLVQIYNPLMVPESLYKFATTQTPGFNPLLALAAIPESGTRDKALVGAVVWDRKAMPRSVAEVFGGLCEDVDIVAEYYLAVNLGVAWELDEELIRRHGLNTASAS